MGLTLKELCNSVITELIVKLIGIIMINIERKIQIRADNPFLNLNFSMKNLKIGLNIKYKIIAPKKASRKGIKKLPIVIDKKIIRIKAIFRLVLKGFAKILVFLLFIFTFIRYFNI
jgi:hypothetical protein